MLSTEFKHGPLSAGEHGYPVIFVAGPEDVPLLVSGINETTCRGGHAIAVAEDDQRLRDNAHEMIVLPRSGPLLTPILAVLPLQMLSYQLSLARGYDPDFPRNLSKTLTVDQSGLPGQTNAPSPRRRVAAGGRVRVFLD